MEMKSPAEWGARVNYDDWNDRSYVKDSVAIHWGGTAQPTYMMGVGAEMEILRSWERYHMVHRGWRGIAYGYAVGMSGTIYRLRGKNNYGAHLGDKDGDGVSNNKEMIPIVVIMGLGGTMTAEAWFGVRKLYQHLLREPWTANVLPVFGHREVQPSKPTQCPGDEIMIGIDKGWVQLPVQPPPELIWTQPGDEIRDEKDAEAVLRYLGLQDFTATMQTAWALDALMRHDIRMTEGGV